MPVEPRTIELRDAAGVDLARHAVIEASAGTGKTYAIVNLVLRLIVHRGVPLDQILVVTFTEKATGELKDRLRQSIERALSDRPDGRDAPGDHVGAVARLRAALDAFDDAPVFTIHGFCQRVLKQYAFENGQPFETEVVGDGELHEQRLREMQRKVWLREHGDGLREALESSGYPDVNGFSGRSDWERRVLGLVARYRASAGDVLLPPVTDAFPQTRAALRAEAARRAAVLVDAVGPRDAGALDASPFYAAYAGLNVHRSTLKSKLAHFVLPALRLSADCAAGPPTLARYESFLGDCKCDAFKEHRFGALRIEKWRAAGDNAHTCPQIEPVIQALEALDRAMVNCSSHLASYTVDALARDVREYKVERGQCSFDDMIARLDEALEPAGNPAAPLLLAALRARFAWALVDEFQDTDPVQWRIFRRVFVEGRPAGLLVIGDPKQAIYAFRGADLGAYVAARQAMCGEHGAARYTLRTNWRSLPALIAAMNRVFDAGGWFPPREPDDGPWAEVAYETVQAPAAENRRAKLYADSTGRAPLTVVDCSAAEPDARSTGAVRRAFAAFAAREITRLLAPGPDGRHRLVFDHLGRAEPLSARHVCILVRNRSEAELFERALRRRGVPFSYYKKPGVWQSDEATQLWYLLDAIASHGDAAAFKKALFTRFFHVRARPCEDAPENDADGDNAGDEATPQAARYAAIRPDELLRYEDLPPAHAIKATFDGWRLLAGRRQWAALFRSILEDTGVLFDDARCDDGERRIANYRQILQTLDEHAAARSLDARGVADLLAAYRREYVDLEEDLTLHRAETERPKVLILTMHRGKGLEFPVVFVGGGFGDDPVGGYFKYHDADGRVVYDLARDPARADAHAREADRENRRLFYVALTRAMYKLYVPYWDPRGDGTPAGGPGVRAITAAVRQSRPHACDEDCARLIAIDKAGADAGTADPWRPAAFDEPPATDAVARTGGGANGDPADRLAGLCEPLFPDWPATFPGRQTGLYSFTALTPDEPPAAARYFAGGDEPSAGEYADDGGEATVDGDRLDETGEPDEPADESANDSAATADHDDAAADVLRGADGGTLLHHLFEHVDYAAVASAAGPAELRDDPPFRALADREATLCLPAIAGDAPRRAACRASCSTLVWNALHVTLPEIDGGRRLCDVPAADRLHELEFHFPVFAPGDAPPPGVALPDGVRLTGEGFLTGVIDLVFRAGGRYYVVDWKSNRLANDDYGPRAMRAAMRAKRYTFQRAIYVVALARWLRQIHGDRFDPATQLGGVYYLFLRGIAPSSPTGAGVCYQPPCTARRIARYEAAIRRRVAARVFV